MRTHLSYLHYPYNSSDLVNITRGKRPFIFIQWLKDYSPFISSGLNINSEKAFHSSLQTVKMKLRNNNNVFNNIRLLNGINSCH